MIVPLVDLSKRSVEVVGNALEPRLVNASDAVLLLGPDPYILLDTWIIIYSLGQVALLLLIGTLWKKRSGEGAGGRGLTLMNMLFTMFLNTIIVCILYYAGEVTNPNTPTGLCLTQATLKHGSGPMTQVAILSLATEVYLSTSASITARKTSTRSAILMLGAPYASFIVWCIPVAIMGALDPIHIERLDQAYYCSYGNNLYGDISTVFGVFVIIAAAVMQALTARMLHRSWRSTRELRATGGIDFSLIVRIWVFVGLQILFIILTVIDIDLQPESARLALGQAIDIFEAMVPLFAFFIFGLRRNVLEVWFWWWRPTSSSSVKSHSWALASASSESASDVALNRPSTSLEKTRKPSLV